MSNWPEQYNETTDIPDLTDIMEDPESGADSESPARESILGMLIDSMLLYLFCHLSMDY